MTTQTRNFIELADLVGLRFDCKNAECGASLSLPMLEDINRTHPLKKCPNCGAAWTEFEHDSLEGEFKKLVALIRSLRSAKLGCAFSLELENLPKSLRELIEQD